MKTLLAILAALAMIAGSFAQEAGVMPSQYDSVSSYGLVADPVSYEGKYVLLRGYLIVMEGGAFLFFTREDAEMRNEKGSFAVAFTDSIFAKPRRNSFDWSDCYVEIAAKYYPVTRRRPGLYAGSLTEAAYVKFLSRPEPVSWRAGEGMIRSDG